ncbi:MAG: hypothetical protein QXJ51_06050 [Sulfolobales archaeon]
MEWSTEIPKEIYAKLYVPWRRVRVEVSIISRLLKKNNARKVIEFGCGVGRHGYLLSKEGFEILLTDVRDWRIGMARKLPFKYYDILRGGFIDLFEGGYSMATMILFDREKMIKALRNIWENLRIGGVFIFDYNFSTYEEPEKVDVRFDGEIYSALLRKSIYRKIDGGFFYEYRVEVVNSRGELVGVEDASYPIYGKEEIFRILDKTDFEIDEVVWASWDPRKYMYKILSSEDDADSMFISAKKRNR